MNTGERAKRDIVSERVVGEKRERQRTKNRERAEREHSKKG